MRDESHPRKHSLLHDIPAVLPDERVDVLRLTDDRRIERIVSRGHASPPGFWYDQVQCEFVLLVSGRAGLRFEADDEITVLEPGDFVDIPARCRHRVEWTAADGDTVWLAVFY
ncbi:MAG: cupin domain-containing protein [Deltaproteobacteria bacterium]|nr:cupin domain-containing protein [Candidatus Anaeroferrophillacea bacterium]